MNPEENATPPRCSSSGPDGVSPRASLSATSTSPAIITEPACGAPHHRAEPACGAPHHPAEPACGAPHHRAEPALGGGLELDPASGSFFISCSLSRLVSGSTPPPCPATAAPFSCQVIIPSPDRRPSPPATRCHSDAGPDLECAVCFSQFNNVFRCPKMLQCRHTFCLECLARINVKSAEPDAIQCPLCRGLTPLPALGLPKLATNSTLLSYLPAAMQRAYSVRFLRNKGKLQVKRSSEGPRQWTRSSAGSLDVGLPNPPAEPPARGESLGHALLRVSRGPCCHALLLTAVMTLVVTLMGIVVFLLIYYKKW
ncbi:RING finger protein 223 [Clinocottus analis]|uniref:RING finger protein 223 n=1 Tax=Clinocottus analis TaxID=304258 RepID=UPI0035C1FCF6